MVLQPFDSYNLLTLFLKTMNTAYLPQKTGCVGRSHRFSMLSWRSSGLRRVVSSTLLGESLSLTPGVAEFQWEQTLCRDVQFRRTSSCEFYRVAGIYGLGRTIFTLFLKQCATICGLSTAFPFKQNISDNSRENEAMQITTDFCS